MDPYEQIGAIQDKVERVLSKVKEGDVTGIAYLLIHEDGVVSWGWYHDDGDLLKMVGSLEALKIQLIKEMEVNDDD